LRLAIADDLLLGSIQGRQQVRSIVLGLDQVALQLVDPGVSFPARTRIADIVAQRHAGDQFLSAKGTEASAGIFQSWATFLRNQARTYVAHNLSLSPRKQGLLYRTPHLNMGHITQVERTAAPGAQPRLTAAPPVGSR
jgi:hypothetical protein